MWLFFCRRDYQNTNTKRVKRTTKTGFWKITGKERVIKDQVTQACVGKKRTLVFHRRFAGRTDWVMHEYYIESDHISLDQSPYVLCRLKTKGNDMADTPDGNGGEPRGDNIPEVENPVEIDPNPSAHGMVQTTNPALGAERFDDRFALSDREVSELQLEPFYSPTCHGFPGEEISLWPSVDFFPYQEQQAQTTNPALGAEGFDDRFALSDKEVFEVQTVPLCFPPHYGFPSEEISLPPSGFSLRRLSLKQEYIGVHGQRKQGLNSSANWFEDDEEMAAHLIPKKKGFFPHMITSLKGCFDFLFYWRTSSEKNSTVG